MEVSRFSKKTQSPSFTVLRSTSKQVENYYKTITPSVDSFSQLEEKLPKFFDGRKKWNGLLSPVMNQGNCGACWSFSSTSCLADRMSIQSLGQIRVILSPAKPIICDYHPTVKDLSSEKIIRSLNEKFIKNGACHGNSLPESFEYLYAYGTTTLSCFPYTFADYTNLEKLPFCVDLLGEKLDHCPSGVPMRIFKVLAPYFIQRKDKKETKDLDLMAEIYHWGPISCGYVVYEDFMFPERFPKSWKEGIYSHDPKSDNVVGGHAIVVVGWGESESGVGYWIIRNSWGKDWGEEGYFKMARNCKYCELESNNMACVPDIPGMKLAGGFLENYINSPFHKALRNTFPVHESGYPLSVVDKMSQEQKKWLKPIVDKTLLPNFSSFVAAKIDNPFEISGAEDNPKETFVFPEKERADWIFWISIILVLVLVYLFLKN